MATEETADPPGPSPKRPRLGSEMPSFMYETGEDKTATTSDKQDTTSEEELTSGGTSSGEGTLKQSAESHPINDKQELEDEIDSDLDLGLGDLSPDPAVSGPMGWLHQQMLTGTDPRNILARILPPDIGLPQDMSELAMWGLIASYLQAFQEPEKRKKLEAFNSLDDVITLLRKCNNIIVLSGAGVSVSCGIPDFRSRDGIYARLSVDFPDLPDPQAMFDIHYFRKDPRPFFKFAKEIYPGQYKPSICHQFISLLEQNKKLLRNYSQNIDTLEQVAGISRVVQCHGSFATATCTNCSYKVDAEVIRREIFNQIIPLCPRCHPDAGVQAILKPDIVFFGEGLPNIFYDCLDDDKKAADLLIVIGSSLKVRPVATIPYPSVIPNSVPQILINREPLPHMNFDIELLGDGDVIINEICHRLGEGWNHLCSSSTSLQEITEIPKQRFQEKKSSCVESDKLYTSLDSGEGSYSGDSFEKAGPSTETSVSPISESCTEKRKCVEGLSRIEKTTGSNIEEISVTESADKLNLPFKVTERCPREQVEVNVEPNSACTTELSNKIDSNVQNSVEESHTRNDHLKGSKHMSDLLSDSGSSYLTIQNGVADLENNSEKKKLGKLDPLQSPSSCSLVQSTEIGSSSSGIKPSGKSKQQKPRRQSVTEYMEASTYLFIPPNRYVFHGAEVYSEESSDEEAGHLSFATSSSDHESFLSPQSEPEYAKCAAIDETLDNIPSDLPSSSLQGDIDMSNQDNSNSVVETMDVKLAEHETDLLKYSQKSATSS